MASILSQASSVLSTASNILSTADRVLSGNLSSLISGGWQGEVEDFNQLRQTARKLMRTSFQPAWLFRLVVPGAPTDFDLYVKDITFPHFDIAVDDEAIGSGTFSWPTSMQSLRVSMNVRDNVDQRVSRFLRTWAAQVVHSDGTVGLPYGANGYVRNVSIYTQTPNGSERLVCTREMYPIQCGEVSMSRDNTGDHMEMPVTFAQFTNLSTTTSTTSTTTGSGTNSTTVVSSSSSSSSSSPTISTT